MPPTKLLVKRLSRSVPLPRYAHADDAGMDLHAAEPVVLPVGERKLIRRGIAIQLPPYTEAQIRPRSGLALDYGVTVLNSPGTIDAGYRGEVRVLLINLGPQEFRVNPGQKIAQLVVTPIAVVEVQEVEKLAPSSRGSGGFGSTDRDHKAPIK